MKTTRLIIILGIAAVILSIPFFAMQLGADSVDWDLSDFIIMGLLLFGSGLALELVLRKVTSTKNRIIFCGLILALLFLVWSELAVGLFGTPFAGS